MTTTTGEPTGVHTAGFSTCRPLNNPHANPQTSAPSHQQGRLDPPPQMQTGKVISTPKKHMAEGEEGRNTQGCFRANADGRINSLRLARACPQMTKL